MRSPSLTALADACTMLSRAGPPRPSGSSGRWLGAHASLAVSTASRRAALLTGEGELPVDAIHVPFSAALGVHHVSNFKEGSACCVATREAASWTRPMRSDQEAESAVGLRSRAIHPLEARVEV